MMRKILCSFLMLTMQGVLCNDIETGRHISRGTTQMVAGMMAAFSVMKGLGCVLYANDLPVNNVSRQMTYLIVGAAAMSVSGYSFIQILRNKSDKNYFLPLGITTGCMAAVR